MFVGTIKYKDKKWHIDAEPYVVAFIAKLFSYTAHAGYEGTFTHRVRVIPDGLDACRDLVMVMTRYPFEISEKDLTYLHSRADEHDRIQYDSEQIFKDDYVFPDLNSALPLRKYQQQACELLWRKKALLLADEVGLGKTAPAIISGTLDVSRPALVVAPVHLMSQWEQEIKKFLPEATVHITKSRKTYDLPQADYYITSYSRLDGWTDVFNAAKDSGVNINTLIFDEVHDLRRTDTNKYRAATMIGDRTKYKIGLSATPIMNYGIEIYNIVKLLDKEVLGTETEFLREWCTWDRVRDPVLLGNYLRKKHILLRRTRKDVDKYMDPVNKIVYTVDCDMDALKSIENIAKQLAMTVFTGDFNASGQAARELDWKLRHATGVAKAKSVAEYAKMIVDSGEKVVVFAWHRDVYDILLKELAAYHPVLYTGSETPAQKEKSVHEFTKGDSKIFIMSLRSGAGLNGLQEAASYCIFGELDWSPGIHEQCVGRLWRDGQKNKVTSLFITINDGADPFMMKVLGLKKSQQTGIVDPDKPLVEQTVIDDKRMKELARGFLESRGLMVPEKIVKNESAELLVKAIESNQFHTSNEGMLQEGLSKVLKTYAESNSITYGREINLSDKDRIDFQVGDIGIECKVNPDKKALYKQVKRYLKTKKIKAVVVVGPWTELNRIEIDNMPVYFANISKSSI